MKKVDDTMNWKVYLEQKFSDDSLYLVTDNTNKQSDSGIYKVASKTNKTVIDFIWPDEQWKTLDDIQYYNESAEGWSGELLGGNGPKTGIYNQENVDYIEKLLEVPIKKGWISEEYYIRGKLFKAVTYENDKGKKENKIFTDFHAGCLGLMLFPLTFLLNIALEFGLVGEIKIVVVGPIEEQQNINKTYSA